MYIRSKYKGGEERYVKSIIDDPDKRYRGARYAKNYNGENEARVRNSDGTFTTKHIGFNQFIMAAEKLFKKDTTSAEYNGKNYKYDDIPKLAADMYLKMCEDKSYIPAYDQFSNDKNYYKLLADFSLYDSQGHYAPHQKVAYDMPDVVPFLDDNGNKQYMPTRDYIKKELKKELTVRDNISEALSDHSEDGLIPQFVKKANELNEKKDIRYKIRYPSFTQTDITNNIEAIANMTAVAKIDSSKLKKTGKRPIDIFNEYFESLGNNIYSEVFGDIALPKASAKSEIRHGITSEKIATIEAIPEVIKSGRVIFQKEKEAGVERIVVCAPIEIASTEYYMGVMLQRDSRYQRLYLHNVLSIEIAKEAISSSKENLLTTGALEDENHLSMTSILKKAIAVKISKQKSAENSSENIRHKSRVDKYTSKRYNRNKVNYRYDFDFLHKNFPSENERLSEAHRLAVWWPYKKDVQAGDQTLISMNGVWYVVEKFDDATGQYQVEERLRNEEFETIYKEIKERGRSGQVKSISTAIDRFNSVDRQRNLNEKRESSALGNEVGYGGQNNQIQGLGEDEIARRERSASNGDRNSQSGGEDKQESADIIRHKSRTTFNINDYSIDELIKFTDKEFEEAIASLSLEDILTDEDWNDPNLWKTIDQTVEDISEERNVEPERIRILVRRQGLGNSYIDDKSIAVMTKERINEAIEDSGAKYSPKYARKYITRLSTKDFIDLTVSKNHMDRDVFDTQVQGDHGSTMGDYDYAKALKDSRQSPKLSIDRETGRIIGHNGRHRIRALEKMGIKAIEIEVEFYDTDGSLIKYGAETIPNMSISSQFDSDIETSISNVIPLNETHRAEIEKSYSETSRPKAEIRYKSRSTVTSGQYEQMKANLSHSKVYSKKSAMQFVKRIAPGIRNRSFEALSTQLWEGLNSYTKIKVHKRGLSGIDITPLVKS